MPYSEIKFIDNPKDADAVNLELGNGWVVLGIEQHRDWDGPENFEDKTRYILGKKEEEE